MSVVPGRDSLGVTGHPVRGSLPEALASGAGWRPVVALGMAAGGLLAQGAALLLAPSIAASLGRDTAFVGHLLGLWSLGAALAVPVAMLGLAPARRTAAAVLGGVITAAGVVLTALAEHPGPVAAGALLAGGGTAVAAASHRAVLAEQFPAFALGHVLAAYRATAFLTGALGLVLAVPLVAGTSLSWRAGLLLVALLVAVGTAAPALLEQPADDPGEQPAMAEAMRRLMTVPSVRPLLAVVALLVAGGFATVVYGGYALTESAGIPQDVLPWVLVSAAVAAAAAVLDQGGRVAAAARQSPTALAARAGVALVVAAGALVLLGAAPWPPARLLGVLLAIPALGVALVAVDRLLLLVVPDGLRGGAGGMATVYAAVVGVALGGALLSSLDAAHGLGLALPTMGAALAVGVLVLRASGRLAEKDVDSAANALVEQAEHLARVASGARAPLLSCRKVSFSYGQLQILFDVDFTVDEGEMVALLGTNGAGKSTLLRVISGLGTPSSGVVRVAGQDITYADPVERVRLGVSQIPGGKAVFGPLSVVDNLRLYGYALGRDRKAVDRGIEESFAAFPRLAERRNSPASTMSGGEQQMLALSKALILQPRLLLIDELSLGLAPKVVGELLELVRTINERGAAVVLVEQSVNVALSLADHAYFMEKGQVRFDGRTEDLLARPDILRSVFLAGAAAHGASS